MYFLLMKHITKSEAKEFHLLPGIYHCEIMIGSPLKRSVIINLGTILHFEFLFICVSCLSFSFQLPESYDPWWFLALFLCLLHESLTKS